MADIATLGLAVDSRPLAQAREQLRGFREDGRGAAETARNFSREIGEATPRFQDFGAAAQQVAGSVAQTVSAIDGLIQRVTLASEAMRAAPAAAAEFLRIGTQLDVLARGFGTSATALEMFTRTSRELGMGANETVSALTRIQQALQGVTAEGQAARRVLENYGVDLSGPATDPQNQARVLRQFRSNFALYGADRMSQVEFATVIPGASLDTQAAFANPSTMTEEQRRRQAEAGMSAERAARQREANLIGARGNDAWEARYRSMSEQYGRDTLSIFDGDLPDWFTRPFATRSQRLAEWDRRRAEGEPTNEDYRRTSFWTRLYNAPGGIFGSPQASLDRWMLTPEQRQRANDRWNPAAGEGPDGRDRRLSIPVGNHEEWLASDEFSQQMIESDILYERESRDSVLGLGAYWSDLQRRAAIRQGAYVPTLRPEDDERLVNPRVRAFTNDTERFAARAGMSDAELERQGAVIAMMGEFGDTNPAYTGMTSREILGRLTGPVGEQRRAAIEQRLVSMERADNDRGGRDLARSGRIYAAGEEGVGLSLYGLGDVEGGREGGLMAGMRAQAVMQALIGIEEKFTDAQERRRAVARALDTIDQQILERRRLSTRAIEDETRAVTAQSEAIEAALRGPGPGSGALGRGADGELEVVVSGTGAAGRGLTALAAAQEAGLRAAAARQGAPDLGTLVRSQGAQTLLQARQAEAQQRLAADNRAAEGAVWQGMASGAIDAAEAQRQLQALRDQQAVQGLMAQALVARNAGEEAVAEKLERQAEAMKQMAVATREGAAAAGASTMEAVTAARVAEAARLRDVAAGRAPAAAQGADAAPAARPAAVPGGREQGDGWVSDIRRPSRRYNDDPAHAVTDDDAEGASRRRVASVPGRGSMGTRFQPPELAAAGAGRVAEDSRRLGVLRQTAEYQALEGPPDVRDQAIRERDWEDPAFNRRVTRQLEADRTLGDSQAAPGRAFAVASAGLTSDGTPEGRRALALRQAALRARAAGQSPEAVDAAVDELSASQRAAATEGGLANIYASTTAGARATRSAREILRRRPDEGWMVDLEEQVQGEVDAGLPESMRRSRQASLQDQRVGATLRGNASSVAELRQETEWLQRQAEAARQGGTALAELRREQQLERELLQASSQARALEVQAREAAARGETEEARRLEEQARLLREGAQARRDNTKARQEAASQVYAGDERIRMGDEEEDLRIRNDAPFWRSSARIERDVALRQYRRNLERNHPTLSDEDRDSLVAKQGSLAEMRETARQTQLLRDSFQQVGASASAALESIIVRGGNARQVIAALVADLSSFALRALSRTAAQKAGDWLSDLFDWGSRLLGGGGGGGGGVRAGDGRAGVSFLEAAQGGVFSFTAMASGEVINAPVWRAMAGGGTAGLGEAGPEAVLPLRRAADGSLGVAAGGGGGGNQTINVNVDASGRGGGGKGGFTPEEMRALAAEVGKAVRTANQEENQNQMRLGGQFNPVFGR